MWVFSRGWVIAATVYATLTGLLAALGTALEVDSLWQTAYALILPVGYVVAMIGGIYVSGFLGTVLSMGNSMGPIDLMTSFSIVALGALANASVAWAVWQMTRDLCRSWRRRRLPS